jgi:hypothetical protein
MQGKGDPLDLNLVLLPKPVNTPGNEIAPRSDIVGEYFQDDRFCHDSLHKLMSIRKLPPPPLAGGRNNESLSAKRISFEKYYCRSDLQVAIQ